MEEIDFTRRSRQEEKNATHRLATDDLELHRAKEIAPHHKCVPFQECRPLDDLEAEILVHVTKFLREACEPNPFVLHLHGRMFYASPQRGCHTLLTIAFLDEQ